MKLFTGVRLAKKNNNHQKSVTDISAYMCTYNFFLNFIHFMYVKILTFYFVLHCRIAVFDLRILLYEYIIWTLLYIHYKTNNNNMKKSK